MSTSSHSRFCESVLSANQAPAANVPAQNQAPANAPAQNQAPANAPAQSQAPADAPAQSQAPADAPAQNQDPAAAADAPAQNQEPVPTASDTEGYNFRTLRNTNTPRISFSSNSSNLRMSVRNIPNDNYLLKGFEDDFMYLLELGSGSHYGRYNDADYWETYYENAANYLLESGSAYYHYDRAGVTKDYLVFKPGTYSEVTVNHSNSSQAKEFFDQFCENGNLRKFTLRTFSPVENNSGIVYEYPTKSHTMSRSTKDRFCESVLGTNDDTSSTDAPAQNQDPAAADAPAQNQDPAAADAPAQNQDPVATDAPAQNQDPVATDAPAEYQEPVSASDAEGYRFRTLRKTSTPRISFSSNSSNLRMSVRNIPNNNYQLKGFEDDFMYLLELGSGSHYGRYNDANYWEEYYQNAANYLLESGSAYYHYDATGVTKDYLVFKPGTYSEVTVNHSNSSEAKEFFRQFCENKNLRKFTLRTFSPVENNSGIVYEYPTKSHTISRSTRDRFCEYFANPVVETEVNQDNSSQSSRNRYNRNKIQVNKIKVKFDVNVKSSVSPKEASVLRPALDSSFKKTRELMQVLPELNKDKLEKVYKGLLNSRDNLIDKIQNKYSKKWPVFKSIFLELRESVKVKADASPDRLNGHNLDKAAQGVFDVVFDHALLVDLAKKIRWTQVAEVSQSVVDQVEESEMESTEYDKEKYKTPEQKLTTLSEANLPQEVEAQIPEVVEEVIYESNDLPDEQVQEFSDLESDVDENFVEEINNVWDYSYEYEIPEFDFTVCQRNYNPVADGTFNDLAYDATNIESLAAHCLKANNIIGGYPDGTFRTDKEVNRAEAAKFLMVSKFMNVENVMAQFNMESFVQKFPGVPAGEWYTEFVTVANRTGVINGYTDGTYKPANTVSTGEFFKMLLSANPTGLSSDQIDFLKSQDQSLVPTDGSVWGPEFFYVVEKFNLLESRSGSKTSVDFNAPMTRGEVAVAIFKYLRDVTVESELFN